MMITGQHIDNTHIDEAQAWQQLLARDAGAGFFYAVTTTGVFCRPDCKSRLPLRTNARFFTTTAEARAEGFRPCMRCHPEEQQQPSPVARICAYLERKIDQPVRLATLGKLVGMSPFTVQRLFKQAMGASPAQYQRTLRANALRSQLREGNGSVTNAIYDAGYSSSSRAYEWSPLGMTPSRFIAGGLGETIRYAVAECSGSPSLGWILVAGTARGLCWVSLGSTADEVETSLRTEFPAATLTEDQSLQNSLAAVLRQIHGEDSGQSLPLDLRGTAFQLRVWHALQQIPAGETRSYSQLAAEIGSPAATRAVARACATNRVAVLIPCHRVIGASGSLTGYRWGIERKRQLLQAEASERAAR